MSERSSADTISDAAEKSFLVKLRSLALILCGPPVRHHATCKGRLLNRSLAMTFQAPGSLRGAEHPSFSCIQAQKDRQGGAKSLLRYLRLCATSARIQLAKGMNYWVCSTEEEILSINKLQKR